MLGKLFNLGAAPPAGAPHPAQATASKHVSSLESVQEDIHTRDLLFPDPHDLYEHRSTQLFPLSSSSAYPSGSTSAFDYNVDVELDARDVRVIIMQDALSSATASLLYDSQPPPPTPALGADRPSTTTGLPPFASSESRRMPNSPRKPSIGGQRPVTGQVDSPLPRQGAFDRRPSVQPRAQPPAESEAQRAWREHREELVTLSSCIFGSSDLMAYKGTSTKVHLVPSEPRFSDLTTSAFGDGRGSLGRSSMRSSRLSQSFSSENISPFAGPRSSSTASRAPDRKRALITRLFPVTLPTDEDLVFTPYSRFSEDSTGFPFPLPSEDQKTRKKPKVKQKRTPMYAVALLVGLPQVSSHYTPSTTSRGGFRGSNSYTEQESFPSSFNSTRPSGWAIVGHGTQGFDLFEASYPNDIEDRMDAITQHWDIIMRTLNHLQSVVASTLFTKLKQADMASPDPLPNSMASVSAQLGRGSAFVGRRSEDGNPLKPPKTNAKHITLLPLCLLEDRNISREIEMARIRIVSGIRANRVTAGQNRWPVWREEARWVAKWAGGREQGFFFYTLLTGFLATHTEWVLGLSQPHAPRQMGKTDEDASVTARTIIVANDKMAARRLVFLLSAFLPASQGLIDMRPYPPSAGASGGNFSPSPPKFMVPILKEESLRRKINRRAGSRRISHSRHLSMQSQYTRPAITSSQSPYGGQDGKRERRASDATSIPTTNLTGQGIDPTRRNVSVATTATVTPETSVAHFAAARRPEVFYHGRPGSSSSMAADDLKRLARDDSAGTLDLDPRQSSRWGNMISGLWNTRRRDSPTGSTHSRSTSGIWGSLPNSPARLNAKQRESISRFPVVAPNPTKGERVRIEAAQGTNAGPGDRGNTVTPRQIIDEGQIPPEQNETAQKARRIPNPGGVFDSPVKTSINLDDGVIEVEVPFPDYMTSFETAVSSPSSSGYLSAPAFGTALDAFEQSAGGNREGKSSLNVAGWLPNFHPDFVLQAIPPQEKDLVDKVKQAMRSEPFPSMPAQAPGVDSNSEKWVDVSEAIIADATTFTIKRIRHRRLLKTKLSGPGSAERSPDSAVSPQPYHLPTPTPPPAPTPSIPLYETQTQDMFEEELIVTLDEVITEAVERVIAIGTAPTHGPAVSVSNSSTDASKDGSRYSSRSNSKRRNRSSSESTEFDELVDPRSGSTHHVRQESTSAPTVMAVPEPGVTEIPRSCCKAVVLSALEGIVQDVMDEQDQIHDDSHLANQAREKDSLLRRAVRDFLFGQT